MRKVFVVTESTNAWNGDGVAFCQLRYYFDIPDVTEVAMVLSDKKHPQAYKLRLDKNVDDTYPYEELNAEARDGEDIYILTQTRRVWTPFINKGMVYLTLEC